MNFERDRNNFQRILNLTSILRYPKQKIYTFWETMFDYKVVSPDKEGGAILRYGKLRCNKPAIITPETFATIFQGFSNEAVEFASGEYSEMLSQVKTLGYQIFHEFKGEEKYADNARNLAERLNNEIENSDKITAVLMSPNDLWGSALMKVMFEVIHKSFRGNIHDLKERGFFMSEEERQKKEIEVLFSEAKSDSQYINELADRLKEYDLFETYEDLFFQFFR
ncbi:MAG: hypothetical protein OEV66_11705 [Spirochaetia bacterium]|nr:hypothetical protein [Spirochaetia bacterium]